MHTQTKPTPETLAALAVEIHQNARIFAVTGTFHGSIVQAGSEGEARRIFHRYYNGESILSVAEKSAFRH